MIAITRLWRMGLQSSILILIILAVRPFLRRYPKIYGYCLWSLVGICLLCPIMIESPFSLQPELQPFVPTIQTTDAEGQAQDSIPGTHPGDSFGKPQKEQAEKTAANGTLKDTILEFQPKPEDHPSSFPAADVPDIKKPGEFILQLLCIVYLAGVGIVSSCYLFQYHRVRRRIAYAVHDAGDTWLCDSVQSPFVIGVFRPRIILPCFLNDSEKTHIIRHETTHIRHHDPLVRLAGLLCICLHWWNPLVWLAVHKMNQDMEIFCDECTLRYATFEERKSYARTLLAFSEKQSGFSVGLAFGESNTERRVKHIMKKRKKNLIVLFCVAVLAAFCAGAFITVPKTIDADAPQTPQEDQNDGSGTDGNDGSGLENDNPDGGSSMDENTPGGSDMGNNSDNPLESGNPNDGSSMDENTPGGTSMGDNSDNPLESGNPNGGSSMDENTPGGNGTDDKDDHFSGNNRDAMLASYASVLDGIYTKHVWPDGQPCPIFENDENYDISKNDFAIYDIDFDGEDELIINFTDSYMAGMTTRVYGYDSILDTVREEIALFPSLTFYDNGIVKVFASHNHGLAATFPDFWPYGLYRYEPASDSYLQIASLTAWDRAQTETDGQRSFPAEADIDGDGVVYFIELFESDTTLTVDGTEFHQWEESVLGGSKEVDIPFQSITQENILGIV